MVNLKQLKEAGINKVVGTKCVDWYSLDGSNTHIMSFVDRDYRVNGMREAIKKMKFGHTFEWQKKGTGKRFSVEKDWDTPKEEFQDYIKYLMTPHRRKIYNIRIEQKGKDIEMKTVIVGKWVKDPNWSK